MSDTTEQNQTTGAAATGGGAVSQVTFSSTPPNSPPQPGSNPGTQGAEFPPQTASEPGLPPETPAPASPQSVTVSRVKSAAELAALQQSYGAAVKGNSGSTATVAAAGSSGVTGSVAPRGGATGVSLTAGTGGAAGAGDGTSPAGTGATLAERAEAAFEEMDGRAVAAEKTIVSAIGGKVIEHIEALRPGIFVHLVELIAVALAVQVILHLFR